MWSFWGCLAASVAAAGAGPSGDRSLQWPPPRTAAAADKPRLASCALGSDRIPGTYGHRRRISPAASGGPRSGGGGGGGGSRNGRGGVGAFCAAGLAALGIGAVRGVWRTTAAAAVAASARGEAAAEEETEEEIHGEGDDAAAAAPAAPVTLLSFYESWSDGYSELLDVVGWQVPEWLEAQAAGCFREGARALDLGCADGTVGDLVNLLCPRVDFTGVDISPGMVAQCRRSPYYSRAVVADLSQGLPPAVLAAAPYDAVTALGCMEFVGDHPRLLADVARALRPGGYLLITLEARGPLNDFEVWGRPKTLYAPGDVVPLLAAHGLRVASQTLQPAAYTYEGVPIPYLLVVAVRDPA